MRKLFLIASLLAASTAFAQNDGGGMSDRLSRLERDINFLQRQVYRDGSSSGSAESAPVAGGASAQVGVAQMQEQVRQMRGEFEKLQYENNRVSTELKKLSADVDFRLRALEEKQQQLAAAQVAPVAAPVAPPPELPAEPAKTEEKPAVADAPKKEAKPSPTGKDFPNSNEHYNHAFKLLNDKNYSGAATSFDEFVHKYPADPLTSNAFYWLGESYYARGDFTRSGESFRKGFEANPDGQKAPDNLYKLAMSLSHVKRTNEACVVLTQIISKYGDAAPRTRDKAATERATLQCK